MCLGVFLWDIERASIWLVEPEQTASSSQCKRIAKSEHIQDYPAYPRRGEQNKWIIIDVYKLPALFFIDPLFCRTLFCHFVVQAAKS